VCSHLSRQYIFLCLDRLFTDGNISRYISPPPPRQRNDIPPVPPLPMEMRGLMSLPRHRRGHAQSQPGVVRPNSQPFAFEANLGDGQRRTTPLSQTPAVTAAPPSHHVPAMGFGGALLAVNARNSRGTDTRRASDRRTTSRLQTRVRHIPGFAQATDYLASRLSLIADHLGRLQGELGDIPRTYGSSFDDNDLVDISLDVDPMEFLSRHPLARSSSTLAAARAKKDEYNPLYTHPGKMPTDFTPDFCPSNSSQASDDLIIVGPSSAASSNSSSVDTILVCAQCFDPLIIGGGPDLSAAARRLWGLRCGHILDGKCVEKLIRPEDVVEQTLSISFNEDSHSQSPASSQRSKGKGKAVAISFGGRTPAPDESSVTTPVTKRSRRLRSGRTVVTTNEPYYKGRSSRRRKGKGRMRAPIIEREYEWRCPVSGCGRAHGSVLIDGQWKMEEKTGAIQMYV
jgi:hypothetical protein